MDLKSLPPSFSQLRALEILSLQENHLQALPDLNAMHTLRHLDLSHNHFKVFPASICQLPALKVLHFANNVLTDLPESIAHLSELYELDLSHNALRDLPSSLRSMGRSLVEINLSHNQFCQVPQVLIDLARDHAPLDQSLPDEGFPDLDMSYNQIKEIPRELFMDCVFLSFEGNQITRIPDAHLLQVTKGEGGELNLRGNPLVDFNLDLARSRFEVII